MKGIDLESGQEKYTITIFYSKKRRNLIIPNKKLFVCCSDEKTLKVWDLENGQEKHKFTGHTDKLNWFSISTDEKLIVSASDDRTLKVWNFENARCKRTLIGHSGQVYECLISPDRKWIVSASNDKTLKVWDLGNGRCEHTCNQKDFLPRNISFFNDGKWIMYEYGNTFKALDIYSGDEKCTLNAPIENTSKYFSNYKIFPNGNWLVFYTADNSLKVFNFEGKSFFEIENASADYFILENVLFYFSLFSQS